MELRDALRTTGAVRTFTSDPVNRDTVMAVLDDARFAPSGGNRQPWRVAIIEDLTQRARLAAATRPVWEEYVGANRSGQVPFNAIDYVDVEPFAAPNPLLDEIDDVPVVLVVAADLAEIAAMDARLDRLPVAAGASIYPFCWNLLLAARDHGLGGVLTTFAARVEPDLADDLALPAEWAIAAVIFLGVPVHQPTKLRRREPATFTYVDRFDTPIDA